MKKCFERKLATASKSDLSQIRWHASVSKFFHCYRHQFLSILLLISFLAPLPAVYTYLKHQKHLIRKTVKHQLIKGIDRSELVLLKFSKEETQSQLRWEHAGEFEFRGEMYDIVEQTQLGDSIYFWCWWDYEETQLNLKLQSLLAGVLDHNPDRKAVSKRVTDFFQKLFHETVPLWKDLIATPFEWKHRTNLKLPENGLKPPSPPPQVS